MVTEAAQAADGSLLTLGFTITTGIRVRQCPPLAIKCNIKLRQLKYTFFS